jgi:hypothetical protein
VPTLCKSSSRSDYAELEIEASRAAKYVSNDDALAAHINEALLTEGMEIITSATGAVARTRRMSRGAGKLKTVVRIFDGAWPAASTRSVFRRQSDGVSDRLPRLGEGPCAAVKIEASPSSAVGRPG